MRQFTLHYTAANRFPAACEIRIYEHEERTTVVASDVGAGPSVTNNAGGIATVLRKHGVVLTLGVTL